jgi:hypothetical protein
MMELSDVIRFENKRPNGAADVVFPTVLGCQRCGGVWGLTLHLPDGALEITDSDLAAKVTLVRAGYYLRINQQSADANRFTDHDGHDGRPDDWQDIYESEPCRCKTPLWGPCGDARRTRDARELATDEADPVKAVA